MKTISKSFSEPVNTGASASALATDAGDAKREHIHRSILALAGLVPAPPPQAGGRVAPTETLVIDDD